MDRYLRVVIEPEVWYLTYVINKKEKEKKKMSKKE